MASSLRNLKARCSLDEELHDVSELLAPLPLFVTVFAGDDVACLVEPADESELDRRRAALLQSMSLPCRCFSTGSLDLGLRCDEEEDDDRPSPFGSRFALLLLLPMDLRLALNFLNLKSDESVLPVLVFAKGAGSSCSLRRSTSGLCLASRLLSLVSGVSANA